jgi:hypothetical protein
LTHNRDSFREGVTGFRNARDWTKEQRDAAIEHASATANVTTHEAVLSTTAADPYLMSFTSESPVSAQIESYASEIVHQGSDTSTDRGLEAGPASIRDDACLQPLWPDFKNYEIQTPESGFVRGHSVPKDP